MTSVSTPAGSAAAGPAGPVAGSAVLERDAVAVTTSTTQGDAGGSALVARGLRKVFGQTVAVADVDLDVPHGAVVGVLGPNGSGKTTVIRMVLGLCRPTAGEVTLLGAPMPDGAGDVLPRVGALVEGPGFHPFLSGRENLLRAAAFEPLVPSRERRAVVDAAIERVGLGHAAKRRYRGYSLGMKQRLGLAAALLVPRDLVILDEPTNGLDPAGTREIRSIIAELRAAGSTVLVSSHLLAEVEATCTHVVVLQSGSVVAQGPLADLLGGEQPALVVRTTAADAAVAALRDAGVSARATTDGVEADLTTADAPAVIAALVHAGVPVAEATRRRTGLEELFTALTEEEKP